MLCRAQVEDACVANLAMSADAKLIFINCTTRPSWTAHFSILAPVNACMFLGGFVEQHIAN